MSDCPVESVPYEPCTPAVFWDVVDFPFPSGLDPSLIYQNMKSVLENKGCLDKVSIMAYVDKEHFRDEDVYTKAGITILPQQGDDYARVHSMLVDIALWAMEHPATYFEPISLMVISKNIKEETDFLSALEALEYRYYNVLLALPQPLSSSELHTVSFEWLSTNLLDGVDQRGTLQGLKHKPKSREETVGFSDGLAFLDPQDFSNSKDVINVFWDIEDCPTEFSSIRPVLDRKGYYGHMSIRPYVDMDHVDDHLLDWGDRITRVVTEGDNYAKVTRMLLDIIFWEMNNDDVPQNFMLIAKPSKDTKCDSVIQALEERGVNVIFRPSDKVASINRHTIDTFESLCKSDGEKLINRSPKLSGRKITAYSDFLECAPIVVLWLTEDCPPSNPKEIWANVRSTLFDKGYGRPLSMTAYVDKQKFTDEMSAVYMKSGMAVKLVPGEDDKYAKVTAMSLDLINHTNSFDGRPVNILVISKPFKDTMCDRVVNFLKHEGYSDDPFELQERYNVLFELPDHMVTFGTSLWSAKSLLGGNWITPM